MANNWPAGVNSKTYNWTIDAPRYPIIEDEADVGIFKRRLRSTKPVYRYSCDMFFSRPTEFDTFQTWVLTNLVGGTQSFNMPWPTTMGGTTKEVRFVFNDNQPYSIGMYRKDKAKISFTIEEM
jgi:hypothetical protein